MWWKKVMFTILLILLMAGFSVVWFWIIANCGFEGNGNWQLLNQIRR